MLCHNSKPKTCPELCRRIENLKVVGIFAIVVTLTFCGVIARAQQPAKRAKIGWLSLVASRNRGQEEIVRLLHELGYAEGKNIDIEFRYAAQRLDRLPELAKELVALKVDLLVTPGTPGAIALKNATDTIPIVFLDVTDPVAAGLVDSLARPGRNLTGFTSIESILAGKRLELLKETVPNLVRVAVIWDPKNRSSRQEWEESQKAARPLNLQLYSFEVSSTDKYEAAFERAVKAHSAAVVILSSGLTAANQELIARLAAGKRLPSIFVRSEFAGKGGLMSYGPNQNERFVRGAALIDKILKGSKPSEIPVEQPTKFDFVINLKTAKQIGLTIPPNVLARADNVIR